MSRERCRLVLAVELVIADAAVICLLITIKFYEASKENSEDFTLICISIFATLLLSL